MFISKQPYMTLILHWIYTERKEIKILNVIWDVQLTDKS